MFEVRRIFAYPFSAVGARWDRLPVPINTKPLHPGCIVINYASSLPADADDERERLSSETIGIGNSPFLFLS